MPKLGDTHTFEVVSVGSHTYVWEFWDGEVKTTSVPTVNKVINKVGELTTKLTTIDVYGQYCEKDIVIVSTGPLLVSYTVSANDGPPGYATTISVIASGSGLTYVWKANGAVLPYSGASLTHYPEIFTIISVRVSDTSGGYFDLDIPLNVTPVPGAGDPDPYPVVGEILRVDSEPCMHLGVEAVFSITVQDPDQTSFAWAFGPYEMDSVDVVKTGVSWTSTAHKALSSIDEGRYLVRCVVTNSRLKTALKQLEFQAVVCPPSAPVTTTTTPTTTSTTTTSTTTPTTTSTTTTSTTTTSTTTTSTTTTPTTTTTTTTTTLPPGTNVYQIDEWSSESYAYFGYGIVACDISDDCGFSYDLAVWDGVLVGDANSADLDYSRYEEEGGLVGVQQHPLNTGGQVLIDAFIDKVGGNWRFRVQCVDGDTCGDLVMWEGTKSTGADCSGTYTRTLGASTRAEVTFSVAP
jgi:hypothetical protein